MFYCMPVNIIQENLNYKMVQSLCLLQHLCIHKPSKYVITSVFIKSCMLLTLMPLLAIESLSAHAPMYRVYFITCDWAGLSLVCIHNIVCSKARTTEIMEHTP